MGLNIYRKRDQQLLLTVEPGTTAEQLLEQLRAGVTIRVCEIQKQQVLIKVSAPHCLAISRAEKCTAEQWHANGKRPSFWQRIARALKRLRHSAAGSAPAR